jgi:hypothetical protein
VKKARSSCPSDFWRGAAQHQSALHKGGFD